MNSDKLTKIIAVVVSVLVIAALIIVGLAINRNSAPAQETDERQTEFILSEVDEDRSQKFVSAIQLLSEAQTFKVTQTAKQSYNIELSEEYGNLKQNAEQEATGEVIFSRTANDFDIRIDQSVGGTFVNVEQSIIQIGDEYFISANSGPYQTFNSSSIEESQFAGFKGIKENFKEQLPHIQFKELEDGVKVAFRNEEELENQKVHKFEVEVRPMVFEELFAPIKRQILNNFANSDLELNEEDVEIKFSGATMFMWVSDQGELIRQRVFIKKIDLNLGNIGTATILDSETVYNYSDWNNENLIVEKPAETLI